MQKKINEKMTCEGKMLSGWVNKYMSERGTFDTEVCSYAFGMDDKNAEALIESPLATEFNIRNSKVRFPKSKLQR